MRTTQRQAVRATHPTGLLWQAFRLAADYFAYKEKQRNRLFFMRLPRHSREGGNPARSFNSWLNGNWLNVPDSGTNPEWRIQSSFLRDYLHGPYL